jgi:hypothetical protein
LCRRNNNWETLVHEKKIELAAVVGKAILEPIEALSFTRGSKGTNRHDRVHKTIGFGASINENDIESDEDRMQAELG